MPVNPVYNGDAWMEACGLTGTSIISATRPGTVFGPRRLSKRFPAKSWTSTIVSPGMGKSALQPWAKPRSGAFSSSYGPCSMTGPTALLLLIRLPRVLNPSTGVSFEKREPNRVKWTA
jgi:hypothetical protein